MLGLIGKKLGMTRIYNDQGAIVPVTAVLVGPNRVVQCKTADKDGYAAVQLGFDDQKDQRVNKPDAGHFKKHGAQATKRVKEFRDFPLDVKPGDILGPTVFNAGDYIDAVGETKGRGFAGVMKRYNFAGGPASHGQKGFSRKPGSIAAGSTPGWVDKGKKMPGHMGQVRRTTQNLEVVKILEEDNILLIKGNLPGSEGDYVVIRSSKKKQAKAVEAK